MFNVFLDDLRPGPSNDGIEIGWEDWIICRSVEQVKYLLRKEQVNNLSLDHDLGENLPTGMDLVKWMVVNNYLPTGEITIHSANPIGAQNMKSLLDNYFLHNPKER